MFKDKGKGKGKGKDRAREPKPDKKGKGKGKGVKFDEQVDEDEVDDEEEEGGRDVMGRVAGDLFDSDDEDEGVKSMSTCSFGHGLANLSTFYPRATAA